MNTNKNTTSSKKLLSGYHSRGVLPHYKKAGATYWVTFHLADSLPQAVLRKIEAEREIWVKLKQKEDIRLEEQNRQWNRLYAKRIQSWLDAGIGACWLQQPEIGKMVAEALQHFRGQRYDLTAWVVMPNHVHVLVTPYDGWTLSSITHSWKSYSATQANRMLQRQGEPFWQVESYDHIVRNTREHQILYDYTINNPVKAGLCKHPKDWPFSNATAS
ncbi:transposase [candidate division KSB1 bacterium]|nr:transposase [candidate division KSB1 bacterium]